MNSIRMLLLLFSFFCGLPNFAKEIDDRVKSPGFLRKTGNTWSLEIRDPKLGKGTLELQGMESQVIKKTGLYVEVTGRSCGGNPACLKVSSITPLVYSPISESHILKLRSQIITPKRSR